jgi:O-antigen/teichoic acid export membrane protein
VLRAAFLPYGPFGVLLQGMQLVALPYAMKLNAPTEVIGRAWRLSMALAVAGVLWGLIVMFVVPASVGTWLLGDLWEPSRTTRALFAVATVGDALTTGPLLALRALRAPGRLVRIRLWAGPITFVPGLLLLPVLGAEGAAIAIVLGFAATLVLATMHLRRIAIEGLPEPVDATDIDGRPA